MKEYSKHYEESVVIKAKPESVFDYADDHRNFSSHMNSSSGMMGGASMKTEVDEGEGKKVGSHIRMSGKVLGFNLFLDEVIIEHEPPLRKAWETEGKVNLLVIDQYKLGFGIKPLGEESELTVYIDYDLPQSWKTQLLGYVFSGTYAKWCVQQMVSGVGQHFK